jgi:hypothetical protein
LAVAVLIGRDEREQELNNPFDVVMKVRISAQTRSVQVRESSKLDRQLILSRNGTIVEPNRHYCLLLPECLGQFHSDVVVGKVQPFWIKLRTNYGQHYINLRKSLPQYRSKVGPNGIESMS